MISDGLTGAFQLVARALLAAFKITGDLAVFLTQVVWFVGNRRQDKIGDAFGQLGKGIVDSLAETFSSR